MDSLAIVEPAVWGDVHRPSRRLQRGAQVRQVLLLVQGQVVHVLLMVLVVHLLLLLLEVVLVVLEKEIKTKLLSPSEENNPNLQICKPVVILLQIFFINIFLCATRNKLFITALGQKKILLYFPSSPCAYLLVCEVGGSPRLFLVLCGIQHHGEAGVVHGGGGGRDGQVEVAPASHSVGGGHRPVLGSAVGGVVGDGRRGHWKGKSNILNVSSEKEDDIVFHNFIGMNCCIANFRQPQQHVSFLLRHICEEFFKKALLKILLPHSF